jgi:cell division inhibitor SepF
MIGGRPVIVNIEGLEAKVYRRIIDFCSGLTYAVGGKIRKVGEQVYLLTPSKVELADEEMERITERAVFRGGEL